MKTRNVLRTLIALALILAACAPAVGSSPASEPPAPEAPAPETAPEAPAPVEEEPLEEYFDEATLRWLEKLDNPNQSLSITASQATSPVALILVAGVITYSVVTQPELIEGAAEAVVDGVDGLRDWVRDSFKFVIPAFFKPEGGELTLKMPGISFSASWEASDSGCSYKGELNGQPLEELKVTDPCNPEDLLSMLYAQLDKFVKLLGDHRARSFLNTLHELISPFMQ